jgi:hypothetical protein
MYNNDVINKATWETEIEDLMTQLGYSIHTESVIAKVKSSAKGNESDDLLYERAWSKFKSLLMAN